MTPNLPAVPVNWEAELKGADMLLKSGLAPRDIKSKEACLFVILAGRDLGLSPVQSLRSIRPVQGKIECSADLQLGLFHRDGGRSKWVTLNNEEAALELVWKGAAPHISRWTLEDAKRASLAGDNWKKYPRAMLRSRAITAGLKDIGYLQGAGVYAPGEIGGGAVIDQDTGEVLPTSDELVSEVAQMPIPQQTSAAEGIGDSLSEEEWEQVAIWQNRITDAYLADDAKLAFSHYKDAKEELKEGEQLGALWKGLDRKLRGKLLEMNRDEIRGAGLRE